MNRPAKNRALSGLIFKSAAPVLFWWDVARNRSLSKFNTTDFTALTGKNPAVDLMVE